MLVTQCSVSLICHNKSMRIRNVISFLYRGKLKLERFSNFSGSAMLSTKLTIIIIMVNIILRCLMSFLCVGTRLNFT